MRGMEEPTTLRAGDSVSWTKSLPAYPSADGWSLHYRLLWPTGTAVEITASASGVDYTVSLTAANTASWAAGAASLVSYVKKGSGASEERATLERLDVTILPDLTTAATFDGRTDNQKALADARAALKAYMASGKAHVSEYDIAGRKMKFRAAGEIIDLINYYEREVARERIATAIANGGAPGRVMYRG
jgi:hypothetical protein